MSARDGVTQSFRTKSVDLDPKHPSIDAKKPLKDNPAQILLPPPISFTNIYLSPPEAFANCDTLKEDGTGSKRDEKPPLPTKPIFAANINMNNNNAIPSPMGTLNGTTKLKNLMLLREPTKKPSIRQVFGEDDSSDSFSDSDDSTEEEENEREEISAKEDTASTVSSISTSSYEQITEENKGQYIVTKITIPEQKLSKCMHLKIDETVWSAKQRILQSLVKKLNDPLNYGLFHEKGRMFLSDHKPMSEYIEAGSVGNLQMRYKCRKMDSHPRNSKEGRQHTKMQSASKRKDFLIHVQQYATDKIYSVIRKGIDPNFQCPNTGETPLTILSSGQSRSECVSVFMALLGGGAHLDYRNKRGFTPMHVAARNGNVQMIKTLLEFKASPNVVDGRDLTPLYHCVLIGSDPLAAKVLLEQGANIGSSDSQGWSEIHQACRHGRLQLLELLLTCDNFQHDMINAKNASGNTPLHVCALYNQEPCAGLLLMHGADASLRNFSNQDAVQVAHVARNVKLAELVSDYPNQKDNVEDALKRARAETYATKPPAAPRPEMSPKSGKKPSRSTWTPSSFKKHSKQYMLQKQESLSGTLGRNYTSSSSFENRFDSKLPPNARMPDVKYPKSVANGTVDENRVRIVVRNYDARTSDELSLRVGTRVIVLNARSAPPGYHDGMIGDQRGFFPKDCVEEVKLRRPLPDTGQQLPPNPYENRDKVPLKKYSSSIDVGMTQRNPMADSISLVSFDSYEDGHSGSGRASSVRSDELAQLQATSTSGIYHNTRNVALWKGNDGFGFILRGAKSEGPVHDFKPSAKIPGLQYLESAEEGSNAYIAGLRAGDFIIMIGDTDVRKFGHQQLVDTIRACGEPLNIQVTTVVHSAPNGDTASVYSNPASRAVKGHAKSDSITSALDQLDNVIAMEDYGPDGAEKTASVRRVPGRKVPGDQLQNIFRHNGTVEAVATLPRQPQQSTFSSVKKPIRVLPPSLSNTSTFKYETPDSQVREEFPRDARSMSTASYPTWSRASGPPAAEKDYRSHSVSCATGERLLAQCGAKSKKVPPPPPKRINSRLSVTIPEEETTLKTTPLFAPPSPVRNAQAPTKAPPVNPQSDMALAIAAAARRRAERASQSTQPEEPKYKPPSPEPETPSIEGNHIKSVAEISSAFTLALAAKRKHLEQQKTNPCEVKKTPGTFTINPSKTPAQRNEERQVLPPPPPMSSLPLPPPPSGYNDVSEMDLPPPPSFPAHGPNSTQYNKDLPLDDLMDLPPPPSDLLPSPSHGTRPSPKISSAAKPSNLGFLPPPPLPPPADDEDTCTSPSGADNLSNADSGVADVAGDGLNLSHHHRHLSHDHVSGDNHSTVSSLSTTSTMSSEDTGTDFPPISQQSSERQWPLREVRNASTDDRAGKDSSSNEQTGNMYLNVLKKAKSKQQATNSSSNSASMESKRNLRPGITVTKLTFAPVASLPPPAEEVEQKSTKTAAAFPPAPKEYSNVETKPLFGKAPSGGGENAQTRKFGFTPKAAPAVVKPVVEKTPLKTTPVIAPAAPKAAVNPAASANNNESPVKAQTTAGSSASKKPLAQWSVSDVCDWLKELGLAMYVSSFEENEITGEHLPDLGKDELIELGVKPFGHRLTIDRSIKKLAAT